MCCGIAISSAAQSVVNKTYPVRSGETLNLSFDYPRIVRISTWDRNEVSVTAHVDINGGENDTAFILESNNENGTLSISNRIRDMKNLPKRYTVIMDGKKSTFRSHEDYRAFLDKGGWSGHTMTSEGVDMEITVEVKVPANVSTHVNAKYGIVEMVNFNAPADINATYGGIDATVSTANTGKLQATTSYGQIYSNLDLTNITERTNRDFYTSFTAETGRGPAYTLKSTYGKIYLRKP